MVANKEVPPVWRCDILRALQSACETSPGITALDLHLVLCDNRKKWRAQEIKLMADARRRRRWRLPSDWGSGGTTERRRCQCKKQKTKTCAGNGTGLIALLFSKTWGQKMSAVVVCVLAGSRTTIKAPFLRSKGRRFHRLCVALR